MTNTHKNSATFTGAQQSPPTKQSAPARQKTALVIMVVLIVCALGSWGLSALAGALTAAQPTATPVFTPTPISLLVEIHDAKGVTMRLVPAGAFSMGSDNGTYDEKPVHSVHLDNYYMDVYEVTNTLYKTCVDAGTCASPHDKTSSTRASYYGNPQFDNYPVINVDWNHSKTYCEWRGARLPTEAEWEKAARGTDQRTYPWGEVLDKTLANYYNTGDTTAVGSYPGGISPYGMYDMAGNVWEWVADWYAAYLGNTTSNSDFGTKYRVLRGGSWNFIDGGLRASDRGRATPDLRDFYVGFRCAR